MIWEVTILLEKFLYSYQKRRIKQLPHIIARSIFFKMYYLREKLLWKLLSKKERKKHFLKPEGNGFLRKPWRLRPNNMLLAAEWAVKINARTFENINKIVGLLLVFFVLVGFYNKANHFIIKFIHCWKAIVVSTSWKNIPLGTITLILSTQYVPVI